MSKQKSRHAGAPQQVHLVCGWWRGFAPDGQRRPLRTGPIQTQIATHATRGREWRSASEPAANPADQPPQEPIPAAQKPAQADATPPNQP
jgi:hypothetical protein